MRTTTLLVFTAVLSLACGGPAPDPWLAPLEVAREKSPPPPPRRCTEPRELAVCEVLGESTGIRAVLTPASAGCACAYDVTSRKLRFRFGGRRVELGGGTKNLVVTPLYWAAMADRSDLVAPLIEAGAHPDQRNPGERQGINAAAFEGRVPLDPALASSHIEVVRALLEQGADLEQADVALAGARMLTWLLDNGLPPDRAFVPHLLDAERSEMLLRAGLPPNARNKHGVPWLHTVIHHPEAVKLLLDAGADPNARDDDGDTALHEAGIQFGDDATAALQSARYLLAAGADPAPRDDTGRTPRQVATSTRLPELAELLEDAGG